MYDKFTSSKAQIDLECHNHFQEVRHQLDMHRERLIEKINDIHMGMIEKTKEIKASYLQYLNKQLEMSLKSYETKSADVKLKELEETFRDRDILIESILKKNFKNKQ